MKQLFSLAAIAALILTGCAKNDGADNQQELTPIRLGSAVATTKAPVAAGDADLTAQIVGTATSATYETLYADAKATTLNLPMTFDGTTGPGTFDDSKVVYYPADGSNVYMRAYYPADGAGVVKASNVVTFTITGQEDILLSQEVTGNRTTAPAQLQLGHQLSKIDFKVQAMSADAIDVFGKVTKVEVLAQPSVLDLNLNDGALAANATPVAIAFTAYDDATGQTLTTTATELTNSADGAIDGSPVMVLPQAANWKLKVYTEKNTSGIEVTSTTALMKNNAYTITFQFKADGISLTATVVNWATGLPENITVQ